MAPERDPPRPLAVCLGHLAAALGLAQVLGVAFLGLLALLPAQDLVDVRPSVAIELAPGGAAGLEAELEREHPGWRIALRPSRVAGGGQTLAIRARDTGDALRAANDAARRHGLEPGAFTLASGFAATLEGLLHAPLAPGSRALVAALLLPAPLAFWLVALRGRRVHGLARAEARDRPLARVAAGAALGLCACAAALVLERLLRMVGLAPQEQLLFADLLERGGAALAAFLVLAVILAPLGEELFFRGFLLAYLLRTSSGALAYGVSAAAFAVVHLNPSALPLYLLLGLILAWGYQRSGGVLVPLVAHAVHNAAVIALALR